ncbi:MAG: DUF202 domain-containing protein [Bacteroidales bacterium]
MNKNELAEERTEYAEDRTVWADQRTFLAQQRTFAGWIRTGLTALAVGFGTIEFMGETHPSWLITTLGLIFIFLGGLIPLLALISFRAVELRMKETNRPQSAISGKWMILITVVMVMAALGGILLIFL